MGRIDRSPEGAIDAIIIIRSSDAETSGDTENNSQTDAFSIPAGRRKHSNRVRDRKRTLKFSASFTQRVKKAK